jgi:hypothetical protein
MWTVLSSFDRERMPRRPGFSVLQFELKWSQELEMKDGVY